MLWPCNVCSSVNGAGGLVFDWYNVPFLLPLKRLWLSGCMWVWLSSCRQMSTYSYFYYLPFGRMTQVFPLSMSPMWDSEIHFVFQNWWPCGIFFFSQDLLFVHSRQVSLVIQNLENGGREWTHSNTSSTLFTVCRTVLWIYILAIFRLFPKSMWGRYFYLHSLFPSD